MSSSANRLTEKKKAKKKNRLQRLLERIATAAEKERKSGGSCRT